MSRNASTRGNLTATTDFSKLDRLRCHHHLRSDAAPEDQRSGHVLYPHGRRARSRNTCGAVSLMILESTTYPGTTDEVLQPMFEEKGFELDEDFLLAFSPERVDPGNPAVPDAQHPESCRRRFDRFDRSRGDALRRRSSIRCIPVSSARVAEACKLWENTFRAINIGMANEMAKLCNALGIDTWEVVRAAATKPFGFMPFYPGPGIGGHCIPLDPHYLSWKARQHGFDSQFISLAEQVNSEHAGVCRGTRLRRL